MDTIQTISSEKIIKARGDRTRSAVCEAGRNQFTEQDLYNWEKNNNQPSLKKLPYLLMALGVSYDDLTEARVVPAELQT